MRTDPNRLDWHSRSRQLVMQTLTDIDCNQRVVSPQAVVCSPPSQAKGC